MRSAKSKYNLHFKAKYTTFGSIKFCNDTKVEFIMINLSRAPSNRAVKVQCVEKVL